jgi:hypothetical protein
MQASEPGLAASDFATQGGPPRHMPVVITTYQGRRASWDGADGCAFWQGHLSGHQPGLQQQFGTFGRLSAGNLDSGGSGGGASSESPHGADADERRRMRR